jgi:arylsulfatase A-like enzyme
VEKGVRFVSLLHRKWDHHKDMYETYPEVCHEIDQPIAALLQDLKARGMLKRTLVVFATEFGRTPFTENIAPGPKAGRDHHPFAYSMWMAGGGSRPGTYGITDDLGWHITDKPVHLHDFHATMLHLFGFDHTRLTYPFRGLNHRLTDQGGKVVKGLLL